MLPQILAVAAALLLLGGLGAFWPALVGAESGDTPLAPLATIGDAITYQGYLTDENDVPLNGTFTMRFQIYSALVGRRVALGQWQPQRRRERWPL